jgi:hypothetical protein
METRRHWVKQPGNQLGIWNIEFLTGCLKAFDFAMEQTFRPSTFVFYPVLEVLTY